MKKRVGILTTFGDFDRSYSPCNVVEYQLQSLVKYGYEPVLFVLENFPEKHSFPGTEIRRTLPVVTFEPYQGIAQHRTIPASFETDVAKIVPVMQETFKDIDILLCHDVIFQDSFLAYNAALRKVPLRKDQKMLHWMHSGPSSRPSELSYPIDCLYTLPPQSKLVYMNGYDTVRAAEMYGVYPADVRVVHNPIDYDSFVRNPLSARIINEFKLKEADIIAIYPLSTTRMGAGGKQLDKAIKIMGFLKSWGKEVRYIVPNAHANGDKEKLAITEMHKLGEEYGLEPQKDLIFTSLLGKEYEGGVPHDVVTDLFNISDIFLFPSVSENCPLVLLEAAIKKNLLILNEDFSPMKDFVGPNALYFKFDSVVTTTNHQGRGGDDEYYKDVSKIILSELINNKIYLSHLDIRKKFNLDYIFQNELEPAMLEGTEPEIDTEEIPHLKEVKPKESTSVIHEKIPVTEKPVSDTYKENEEKADFPDFDHVYKRYKEKGILKDPTQIKIYEAISNQWCIGKAVLDAGCGMGIGTNILGREALGVWGIDNNPDNINVARQLYENMKIKFEVVDLIKELPRPVATFDVITLIEVFEHIKDQEILLNTLKKFGDKKRRTIFFISSPNRNSEKLGKDHPRNEWHVKEMMAGEFYEFLIKHFRSVVLYSAEKLDTFDISETVDGLTTDTPILAKCEDPIL